jgi:transcriptional regulator with XRE-family HTH domain
VDHDSGPEPEDRALPRLAARLKGLRDEAGHTQGSVAARLNIKGPMVSGYENGKEIPTEEKIRLYAGIFARDGRRRDELETELLTLRAEANRARIRTSTGGSRSRGNPWQFPDGNDVTLVCGELPPSLRMPYAQPRVPDYVRAYRYADPDTLLELWGHIPGANAMSRVRHITSTEYDPTVHDTDHLIVIGGIDFNEVTERLLADIRCPIKQDHFPPAPESDGDAPPEPGTETLSEFGFRVEKENGVEQHRPVLKQVDDHPELLYDIGLVIRGPNPYNASATLTMFNAMYSRGVLGAALALTHRQLRDRNMRYLTSLGADTRVVAVLFKVRIMNEKPSPPDLTNPDVFIDNWVGPAVTD